MADHEYGFRTRAIHAGNIPDPVTGARAVPIYQTSAFVFDDAEDAAARFALQKYGTVYSRLANPTVAAFEERIASLEGALGAVATASGLGAQYIAFAALAGAGDHIVASAQLYGGSLTQLDVALRRFGVETTFIRSSDPADYAAAITDRTKVVFAESVANPSGDVADVEGLADVAHAAGVPLMIDATVATPYLSRPMEWGADIVVHSATKFLGGHGTTLGGVVSESGRFEWHSPRFPLFGAPVPAYGGLEWSGNFGEFAFLTRLRAEQLRDIGPVLAPHSAFLLMQG
ncbi:MAG TPA: aminotransferase class I/II-fold pyridoxal phosphate-dependent enzyme, partial [Amnibacterium sp.]|nr:aminotransferase class I/II-fold pyridoxal phosphate-dependent enzyme [Amnibacterium sp.]